MSMSIPLVLHQRERVNRHVLFWYPGTLSLCRWIHYSDPLYVDLHTNLSVPKCLLSPFAQRCDFILLILPPLTYLLVLSIKTVCSSGYNI